MTQTFEQRLKRLEQCKREYRERLANLPRQQQKIVEDGIWAEASELTFIPHNTRQAFTTIPAQTDLVRAFQSVRHLPKNTEITSVLIANLHQMIERQEAPYFAGHYRHMKARWNGTAIAFANYAKVPDLIDKISNSINNNTAPFFYEEEKRKGLGKLAYHPVMRAIETGYSIIATHPFPDANKRVMRAVISLVLTRAGHIPIILHNKQAFINGVINYNATHQPHTFVRHMIGEMEKSYQIAFDHLRAQERQR